MLSCLSPNLTILWIDNDNGNDTSCIDPKSDSHVIRCQTRGVNATIVTVVVILWKIYIYRYHYCKSVKFLSMFLNTPAKILSTDFECISFQLANWKVLSVVYVWKGSYILYTWAKLWNTQAIVHCTLIMSTPIAAPPSTSVLMPALCIKQQLYGSNSTTI